MNEDDGDNQRQWRLQLKIIQNTILAKKIFFFDI